MGDSQINNLTDEQLNSIR